MVVHAWVVPQTVQLSNDKGGILVCLMPNSQEDATLGFKYNHVKLQAQPLCMFIKNKKKSLKARTWLHGERNPFQAEGLIGQKLILEPQCWVGGWTGGGMEASGSPSCLARSPINELQV